MENRLQEGKLSWMMLRKCLDDELKVLEDFYDIKMLVGGCWQFKEELFLQGCVCYFFFVFEFIFLIFLNIRIIFLINI